MTSEPSVTSSGDTPLATPRDPSPLPVMPAQYTDSERRIAKAAADRFGESGAQKVLSVLWPDRKLVVQTVAMWHRDPRIVPGDEDREMWAKYEADRRARLQVRLETTFDPMLDLVDEFVAAKSSLDVQRMMIGVGILYDKLVPPRLSSNAINIGDNANVTLNVIAPPTSTRPPRLPETPAATDRPALRARDVILEQAADDE